MYADGWHKVQAGVLRRDLGKGKLETLGYGTEGFQWLIASYSQQLTYFEGKYQESPTDKLASLIGGLRDKIDALKNEALTAPPAESFAGEQSAVDCTISYGYDARAESLIGQAAPSEFRDPTDPPAQGVMAQATASFQSTCGDTGNTFAYAYAHATDGTVQTTEIQQDPKNDGTSIASNASASALGYLDCESIAQSSVEIPSIGLYKSVSVTNHECLDMVVISGPPQVLTDFYGPACADVTWNASTVSQRTDYSFEWYIGTDLAGTGPALTQRYCSQDTSVTVRAVARDSAGKSYEAPFTTKITYSGPITVSVSGPDTVSTDYYGSSCANATYTATASSTGEHFGYSYQWYLGTDPTVKGTASTFSTQFCNTNQSVPVKVVVTASDGHSESATKTTNVVYRSQLTTSVNGPATVTTDYYTSACATVTWTASAAGGHPGYTYKWYIGTSTTVQGTGGTFSQTYCNTSPSVTVRAVATDSDGHTAISAPFTTSVQYRAVIVPKITGPATVSTNSTTPCADVTWTASASGSGHTPFTYKWYLGTSTIVQGTGTTFTKRYCNTSQTVSVKLAAAAGSDNHSDTATFSTKITYTATPPPLTASISGPTEVDLVGTQCQTVTWTSSVSGGTPAYSYSWTIGTSTTVLSTTSTLTKSVCSAGTLNVKVVVRDAAAQTTNATFTTTVYKEPVTTCLIAQCP
jgi:hypothetical protein